MISDASKKEATGQNMPQSASCVTSHHAVDSNLSPLDLNTSAQVPNDMGCDVFDKCKASPKQAKDQELKPYKLSGCVKSAEASECGSSTSPLEENESYRRWKEMKKNGFLSSAHGGIPMPAQPQPKPQPQPQPQLQSQSQRGKKRKSDQLKKKMERAKREQVHRFTKIAAPSGLLNELNPGIINHVRNSKQVLSIIEALVKSEKHGTNTQNRSAGHLKGEEDTNEKGKHPETDHDPGASRPGVYLKAEPIDTSSANMQTKDYTVCSSVPNKSLISEHNGGCGNTGVPERWFCDGISDASHLASDDEDEMLALKLSSSITTAMVNGTLANHASASSFSARAATVASQWLELLYQDIKGRLAALRRSKKRVQAVVQTELPFLLLKEFSSTQENDSYARQSSSNSCSTMAVPDMHRARWTALFSQMDNTLTEEGKHLESWLNQVKEMQLQCEWGLQCVNTRSLQSVGRSESGSSPKMETAEKELSVRAAAASIYSTCNFIKATEDVSCF